MKRFYVLFSLAIVSVLILSLAISCASPTPTTTAPAPTTSAPTTSAPAPTTSAPAPTTSAPAPTTSAPAPSTTAAPKAIKLVYSVNDPEPGLMGDAFKWWSSEINKRTNGQVTVQIFWNSALAKMPEQLEAVQKGTADMGNILAAYHPQVFPLHGNLEHMTVFHNKPLSRIMMNDALDKLVPEAEAEWGKAGLVKVFTTTPNANYHYYTVKPITKLSDFKGLKTRATGFLNPAIVEAMGGTTVGLTGTDEYDALVKGTLDATAEDLDSVIRFRAIEIVKGVVLVGVGANNGMTALMKAEVYNQLPDNVKKVIADLRDEYPKHFIEMFKNYFNTVSIPAVQKYKVQVYNLTDDDWKTIKSNPKIMALQTGWVDKVAGYAPSLSKDRITAIGKLYQEKLAEMDKLYPDTLAPGQ